MGVVAGELVATAQQSGDAAPQSSGAAGATPPAANVNAKIGVQLAGRVKAAVPRLEALTATEFSAGGRDLIELRLLFRYRLPKGGERPAQGRVYVPRAGAMAYLETGALLPLVYHAGYEVQPAAVSHFLVRGACVVTPHVPEITTDATYNPLARGVNLDFALLHIARSLPFMDLGRLLITGGSAGGYMSLMTAAETFPLAATISTSPVVHHQYFRTYLQANRELVYGNRARFPFLSVVMPVLSAMEPLYGTDINSPAWMEESPVNHLQRITGRVLLVHSTADPLVPICTIGEELALPIGSGHFPAGFRISPGELGFAGMATVLTRLNERAPVERVTVSRNAPRVPPPGVAATASADLPRLDFPWPARGWLIVPLDEGPPEPDVGHFKYQIGAQWPFDAALAGSAGDHADDLSIEKLAVLMRRLAGHEWIGRTFNHLDFPEAERADVLRGLRWWAADPARAAHLHEVYGRLPVELQLLGTSPKFAVT